MTIYVKKKRVECLEEAMSVVDMEEFYCSCVEDETIHKVRRTAKGTLFIQCTQCGEISLGALEEISA